jgi:putative transposase
MVVDQLDCRAPGLSRRLNRLISNTGRGFIEAKLKDLEERFGIRSAKVMAAYSSQADSACGYVDRKNRKLQAFRCLWCGRRTHAEVNVALNLVRRRSPRVTVSAQASRDALLDALVRQHTERFTRPRGGPPDPRLSNPYFRSWTDSMRLIGAYT